MSKQDQVLIIEPHHELKFVGSFTLPITAYIKLTNPTSKQVGFKIKTTAPKKYCVRPNSGVLASKDHIDIAVSLQAHDFDQSEKNKHKFMVQTMFVPEGEQNLEALWKDVKEGAVMSTKLKCVFERKDSNAAITGSSDPDPDDVVPIIEEGYEKRIGDSPSVQNWEAEAPKASPEAILRKENRQLKEEILRLQQLVKSHPSAPPHSFTTQAVQQAQPVQPVLVLIAIVVGMVGIVLGKFIL